MTSPAETPAEASELTLTGFLLARITEDEGAARTFPEREREWATECRKVRPDVAVGRWNVVADRQEHGVPVAQFVEAYFGFPYGTERPTVDHIARFDPARVLRECKAKRRIVSDHRPEGHYVYNDEWPACDTCGDYTVRWPCDTLRALAAVYADHPDYRSEWRG